MSVFWKDANGNIIGADGFIQGPSSNMSRTKKGVLGGIFVGAREELENDNIPNNSFLVMTDYSFVIKVNGIERDSTGNIIIDANDIKINKNISNSNTVREEIQLKDRHFIGDGEPNSSLYNIWLDSTVDSSFFNGPENTLLSPLSVDFELEEFAEEEHEEPVVEEIFIEDVIEEPLVEEIFVEETEEELVAEQIFIEDVVEEHAAEQIFIEEIEEEPVVQNIFL